MNAEVARFGLGHHQRQPLRLRLLQRPPPLLTPREGGVWTPTLSATLGGGRGAVSLICAPPPTEQSPPAPILWVSQSPKSSPWCRTDPTCRTTCACAPPVHVKLITSVLCVLCDISVSSTSSIYPIPYTEHTLYGLRLYRLVLTSVHRGVG